MEYNCMYQAAKGFGGRHPPECAVFVVIRERYSVRDYLVSNAYASIGIIAVFDLLITHRVVNPFDSQRLSEGLSLLILLSLSAVLVAAGALLTFRTHPGAVSILLTCAIPLEIYSLLCIWRQWLSLTFWLLCALAACAAALVPVAAIVIKDGKKSAARMARSYAIMLRPAAALLLLPFLVLTVAQTYLPEKTVPSADRLERLLTDNADAIGSLTRSSWTGLSEEQKVAALQIVAELESAHLGTPETPQIVPTDLDGLVRGQYHPLKLTIFIDDEWLMGESSSRCVTTVLHEMYHYYQFCMTEALADVPQQLRGLAIFEEAVRSAANFGDYKNEGDDYFAQPIEVDARAYADQRIAFYIELVGDLE